MKASEQVMNHNAQRGKLIVLPKVWAVAEKKPCASVRAVDQLRKANTGVSPRRRSAPSVEMTHVEGGALAAQEMQISPLRSASVEMTGGKEVEVAFYRKYTEAMLRRYAVMSMESGRVPSMLGREMFRGKVTSYRMHGFDDVVIFCHDVETCMKRLPAEEQELIKRVAVQQYTHGEAALMLGVCLRTCVTQYAAALDRLTRRFLEVKLLEPLKVCQ